MSLYFCETYSTLPPKTNDDPTPCKSTAAYRRIAAVSIFAFFHSAHDLHQLKKACFQQRGNAVRSMYYTM